MTSIGICFDLDGVLIDTMPLHAQAWQEALKEQGMRVARRLIYVWEGEPGTVTARRLLRHYGRKSTPQAITALLHRKEQRFGQLATHIRVHPQLVQALRRLAHSKVLLGLVTGTSSREIRRILPRSVLKRFDAIVTGDRVRHGKPHPEPYRKAFAKLHLKPQQAIVVENAPNGIQAARRARAGLIIALASSLPKRFLKGADLIVDSVDELNRILKQLNGRLTSS